MADLHDHVSCLDTGAAIPVLFLTSTRLFESESVSFVITELSEGHMHAVLCVYEPWQGHKLLIFGCYIVLRNMN